MEIVVGSKGCFAVLRKHKFVIYTGCLCVCPCVSHIAEWGQRTYTVG